MQRPRLVGLAATLAVGLGLAPHQAAAGSESSNTSSNCSNGHCTRLETRVFEDRRGVRGYGRFEAWDERERGRPRLVWPDPRHMPYWRRDRRSDQDDD